MPTSEQSEPASPGLDGSIDIYAPITLYGSGATQAMANAWGAAISQYWNGHSWNNCPVHVHAPITVDSSASSWITASGSNNYVFVDTGNPNYRSDVRWFDFGLWGRPLNYSFGDWGSAATPERIAHEFGHLLLLPDLYTDDVNGNSITNPGAETDIMGADWLNEFQVEPHFYDFDQVLAGRACGCKQR